jgi:hypothetical protein
MWGKGIAAISYVIAATMPRRARLTTSSAPIQRGAAGARLYPLGHDAEALELPVVDQCNLCRICALWSARSH